MTCVPDLDAFRAIVAEHGREGLLVPMVRRLFADALTPVLAYRRIVGPDDRLAPSFLYESVFDGANVGRYSFLGSRPQAQVIARGREVRYVDHVLPDQSRTYTCDDPLAEMARLTGGRRLATVPGLPPFTGGWVGYAGYDTVRYLEGEKLPSPPPDDRGLPDLHFQLYNDVIAFDHVQKTLLVITHVALDDHATDADAHAAGAAQLDDLVARLVSPSWDYPPDTALIGDHIDLAAPPPKLPVSTMGEGGYQRAVETVKEYVRAGDAFQVVPSQRFELRTQVDPFDIYRALRVVNPSPYMFYLQIDGGMLVGSSPEILVRVEDGKVTNRPLAGTRRRGATAAEDAALEDELLADPKDRAEHIMLVDLGRNDVGRIAKPGSIDLPAVMAIERYSHVMHISSTVTGQLRDGLTCWDALRHTLPVGTVSGAPKVRAMQIIDEVEPTRRGPYGGAVGYADFAGNMDMAIALRTMVILPDAEDAAAEEPPSGGDEAAGTSSRAKKPAASQTQRRRGERGWRVHLQAGGGIVYDSDPDAEHQETVNKAAALAKAVDVAERAFGVQPDTAPSR